MTFVPPSEDVTGPPPMPGEPVTHEPIDLIPQNDHPGFSDQEWSEIQSNLDSHYRDLYGSDPGQTGAPVPAEGIGNQPPVPVPVFNEYDLGAVKVPVEDAPGLSALYTFIRNNPDKSDAIMAIIEGRTPQPPVAPPIWQQQPTSQPVFQPAVQGGWQGGMPQPSVQIVPPEVIDSMDPATRYMFDRMQQMEASQQSLLQAAEQSRQAEAQRQATAALNARVQQDTIRGVARFKAAHPELTDDQMATINTHYQQLGIIGGLLNQLPGDQAVAKALELARLDLGSSLTGSPLTPTVNADVTRQRTLTSLAGSSSGSVPRQEAPAPLDTAPDPDLSRAKKAALDMLRQSNINLADHL